MSQRIDFRVQGREERTCTENQVEMNIGMRNKSDGFLSRFLVLYKLSSTDRTPLYLRTFSSIKMDEGRFYNLTMLFSHI